VVQCEILDGVNGRSVRETLSQPEEAPSNPLIISDEERIVLCYSSVDGIVACVRPNVPDLALRRGIEWTKFLITKIDGLDAMPKALEIDSIAEHPSGALIAVRWKTDKVTRIAVCVIDISGEQSCRVSVIAERSARACHTHCIHLRADGGVVWVAWLDEIVGVARSAGVLEVTIVGNGVPRSVARVAAPSSPIVTSRMTTQVIGYDSMWYLSATYRPEDDAIGVMWVTEDDESKFATLSLASGEWRSLSLGRRDPAYSGPFGVVSCGSYGYFVFQITQEPGVGCSIRTSEIVSVGDSLIQSAAETLDQRFVLEFLDGWRMWHRENRVFIGCTLMECLGQHPCVLIYEGK
jgi:hypothetical protein